tara:strand:+ start:2830 stop:3423 length:594 start_codon:yes stop_codon:yes gene_type:complete
MKTDLLEKEEIYIIDDVIPKTHQDLIEKRFCKTPITYTFNPEIGHINFRKGTNFGFSKQLKDNTYIDPLYYLIEPIAYASLKMIDKKLSLISLARIFTTTGGTRTKKDVLHTDSSFPHNVILYYINDADGDTILFDLFNDNPDNKTNFSSYGEEHEQKIKKSVTPKKGRVVIFNGLRYHCATRPKKNFRSVLNFNTL